MAVYPIVASTNPDNFYNPMHSTTCGCIRAFATRQCLQAPWIYSHSEGGHRDQETLALGDFIQARLLPVERYLMLGRSFCIQP